MVSLRNNLQFIDLQCTIYLVIYNLGGSIMFSYVCSLYYFALN